MTGSSLYFCTFTQKSLRQTVDSKKYVNCKEIENAAFVFSYLLFCNQDFDDHRHFDVFFLNECVNRKAVPSKSFFSVRFTIQMMIC